MNINLYRNNEIICELPVDDSAVCLCKMMGEHSIKMKITVAEPLVLQVGDYLMEDGIPFTLYDEADFTHAAGTCTYQLTFYAPYYQLNYVYHKSEATSKFDYYGGVREHLTLLLNSMHELDGGFALGEVEENGTQLLNFDKTYCLAALNKICEAFKLEYRFDGKTLHVKQRVGVDRDSIFRYGRNNGLYSLERQGVTNRSVVTKLTGKGGSSNLPVDYRHNETPIPDTLVFGKRHLTLNTAKYGIREDEKTFEDIYPRLKDKKVLSVEVPADIDKATAWKLELDIPFDLNAQLAPEKDALVHFTSGELQGESFTIVNKSFNPETQELRIIVSDNDGYVLPRASRQPRVGDSFVLLDIIMPADPYVTEAEAELEARTLEELKKICVRQFAHKLSLQERYIRKNNIRLQAGDKVTVKDSAAGLDALIRITEVSYPLASPHKLSVLLSDEILYSYDQKIRNDINDITADVVNAYRQIQNTSRRAWKDARELSDMIQGLEAELLLVGNPEGQFTVTSVFKTNKNNNPNNFVASAGTLQHKVYTDNPATGIWSMEPYTMVLEKNVPYFLYARCSKANKQGMFLVSETAKEVEDADYYYFRVGLISSVFENARILKTTSGFTQIAGGDITAEKLQDAQQRLVIDLVNAVIEAREGAVIRGKIEFKSISGDYKDVETTIDEKATAAGTTAAQEKIDGLQFGGVNCCDNFNKWTIYDHANTEIFNSGNTVLLNASTAMGSNNISRIGEFITSLDVETFGDTIIYIDPRGNVKKSSHDQFRFDGIYFRLPPNFKDRIIMYSETPTEIYNNFYFAIDGRSQTFKCKFSYPQFELGNKATAWTPSLADQQASIQEKIDGLQIGGENLLNNSKGVFLTNSDYPALTTRENGKITVNAAGSWNAYMSWNDFANGVLNSRNKKFMVSFEIKTNTDATINTNNQYYAGGWIIADTVGIKCKKNEWIRVSYPAPTPDAANITLFLFTLFGQNQTGLTIEYRNFMFEYGDKASAYKLSEADQQASIQEKIDGLQIGTVNIFNNSGNFTDSVQNWRDNGGGLILDSATKYNGCNTIKTVIGHGGITGDWYKLENGVEYTYCAMIKSNVDLIGNGVVPLHYWTGKDNISQSKIQIIKYDTDFKAGEWKLAYVTFKLIDGADSFKPYIYMSSGSTIFNIAFLALIKGNRPLEQWSPSLADQKAQSGDIALANAWGSGKMLYTDPAFKNGLNGINVYNNLGNGNVTLNRIARLSDSPAKDSDYNLEIKSIGEASPGLGGVYIAPLTRSGAVYIYRMIAKIPQGFRVGFARNEAGDNPKEYWATPTAGTGKFEEYLYVLRCGKSGAFTSCGHFYLGEAPGTPSTPGAPVTWHLAYASVFDMINGSNAQTDAAEAKVQANSQAYLKEAFQNETTLQAGLVSTTLIKLGATNSSANWIEKAGINGSLTGRGNNDIRFYAGGDLASAIRLVDNVSGTKATFAVTEGGKLYAKNAEISGKIEATGGKIGNFEIDSSLWFRSEGMGLSSRQLNFDYPDRSVIIGSHPRESVASKPILGMFDLKNTTGVIYNEAYALFLKAPVNRYTKALCADGSINLLNLPKGDTNQLYGNNNISSGDIVVDTGQNSMGFCMLRIKL